MVKLEHIDSIGRPNNLIGEIENIDHHDSGMKTIDNHNHVIYYNDPF